MKCFVALASCLLLLLVVVAAHAYSDCELADGLDYIHDIVVEEVGCCGVYSCGYPDIGQVRRMMQDDAAFWGCLKEYRGVKEKNLGKKVEEIIKENESLFVVGRSSVTELMDSYSSACPWYNTATGTGTGTFTGRTLDREECLNWDSLIQASEIKFFTCVHRELGDKYPVACPDQHFIIGR